MRKYSLLLSAMLAVTAVAAPAIAQDVPAAAKENAKPKAGTISGSPGAASASYARCVAGGEDPPKEANAPDGSCPSAEAAEGKGRTYTGGRRNEDAPTAAVEAVPATPASSGDMPSRLSMTPTTAKKVAPAQPARSISEKGIK